MRITPPQTKPPVPQISPGQTSIKVPYIGPAEKEELIGRIPEDHYVSTNTFSYSSQLIANPAKAVYANQPQRIRRGRQSSKRKQRRLTSHLTLRQSTGCAERSPGLQSADS